MMLTKCIKKISVSFLTIMLILTFTLITNFNLNAKVDATLNVIEENKEKLYNVDYYNMSAKTTCEKFPTEGNQYINVFKAKTDGVTSKLVNWAIQSSNNGYARTGLSKIAKDYEEKHPGWIVVAGINADQYYPKYGSSITSDGSFYFVNQPYYPLSMDNENRFVYTPLGESMNYVGISNDASKPFISSSHVKGLYIELLDENGNIILTDLVEGVNQSALTNQTTIWMASNNMVSSSETTQIQIEKESNYYVISNPDLAYKSNSKDFNVGAKVDALFVKGNVDVKTNNILIKDNVVAIDTTKTNIINALENNPYVRIEYLYENDELNNCEAIMGFHSAQRIDNVDVETSAGYDTQRYNRSIFGITESGEYVLMTISKGEYAGTSQDESNKILQYYGVKEAYQQDGGGSVTAIIRNGSEFDVVQESSDSGTKERSILNGCFFVVRDPGYTIYTKDNTRTSITLSKTSNINDSIIKSVKAEVNGNVYELKGESFEIDGLENNKEYDVLLTYTIVQNGKEYNLSTVIKTKTLDFDVPSLNLGIRETNGNSVVLYNKMNNDLVFKDVKLIIGKQEVNYENLDEDIYISNLSKNTVYDIKIQYMVYDDLTKNYYPGENTLTIKTLSYNKPRILSLDIERTSKTSVNVSYEIEDLDNIVSMIYIFNAKDDSICEIVESLKGKVTFDGLNIDEDSCSFIIAVSYDCDESGEIRKETETISKDTVYPNKPVVEQSNDSSKKKSCKKTCEVVLSLLSALSLVVVLWKKK